MKRNVLTSPRLLELKLRRQKILWGKVAFVVFGLGIIVFGLTYVSRLAKLNIAEVEVVGNKVVDSDTIEGVVRENLSGKYFWLIPKTNFLFYPKNKIISDLSQKFNALNDIAVNLKTDKLLEISVTEKVGVYIWCGVAPVETAVAGDNKKCNFMDASGFVFDQAPYYSGEVYFKFYGKVFQSPYLGFENLILFKEGLERIGVKPIALYVAEDGNGRIFLSPASQPSTQPEVLFKTDADYQKLTDNLQTVITTPPFMAEFKNKYSSLLYIDLRFGNKVYYKFQ